MIIFREVKRFYTALCLLLLVASCSENDDLSLDYQITMDDPASQYFHVELAFEGLRHDTVNLSLPSWTPGYYQLMDYAKKVKNIRAVDQRNNLLKVLQKDNDTWEVVSSGKPFRIGYDVKADRRFVANSFLDSTHAYIVPASVFMFIEGMLDIPVTVTVKPINEWKDVVTGLEKSDGESSIFTASDFDILYDCPILSGNLAEIPSFEVQGVSHRFVGYDIGDFDGNALMKSLKKIIEASVEIFGEVPYDEYTFIGIGEGAGGIEHLNSTTVSFNASRMNNHEGTIAMLKFLAHEYFHNFNVKRIRPIELGPFDYSRENRTNLLWFSEGVTVYYEYLLLNHAGIISKAEFLASVSENISAYENDPGRKYQSLVQASYNTWSDGPFGSRDPSNDKSISCYDKGAIVGFILDLSIRNATSGKKSLDDVMRSLYDNYYKTLGRGFTDAELQAECELIAGVSLSAEFEYVYTTKDIDYEKYLSLAGLKLNSTKLKVGKLSIYLTEELPVTLTILSH
jgi:predicted metalloprotease with PDZ domain